jgi:transposase
MTTRRTPILTDADWLILKVALDEVRSKVGRPFANERRTIEAVVWRFRTDARWREIPPELGPWWRAAQLHYRWQRAGLWERLCNLLRDAQETALADTFGAMLDSSPADSELDEESLSQVSAGALFASGLFYRFEGRLAV